MVEGSVENQKRSGAKRHERHGDWSLHSLYPRDGLWYCRARHLVDGRVRCKSTRERVYQRAKSQAVRWVRDLEVQDLASEVQKLREAGARFRNDIVTGNGGKQILVEDPAGNAIELFEPAPKR